MSVWVTVNTVPATIVMIATAHSTGCQSAPKPGSATYRMRSIAPNAAILVAEAMKPVIGVGAPWYTSGIHEWNGTAPTLNSNPTVRSATPTSAMDLSPPG